MLEVVCIRGQLSEQGEGSQQDEELSANNTAPLWGSNSPEAQLQGIISACLHLARTRWLAVQPRACCCALNGDAVWLMQQQALK